MRQDLPLREIFFAAWLHTEEAPPHVDQFPGEKQGKPRQTREACRTSSVNSVTVIGVGIVAILSQVTVSETEENERKRAQTQSRDPKTINEHVDHHF